MPLGVKRLSISPAKTARRGWDCRRQHFPPSPSGLVVTPEAHCARWGAAESQLCAQHAKALRSLEHLDSALPLPAFPSLFLLFHGFLGPTQCPEGKKYTHKLISTALSSCLDLPDVQKGKSALYGKS